MDKFATIIILTLCVHNVLSETAKVASRTKKEDGGLSGFTSSVSSGYIESSGDNATPAPENILSTTASANPLFNDGSQTASLNQFGYKSGGYNQGYYGNIKSYSKSTSEDDGSYKPHLYGNDGAYHHVDNPYDHINNPYQHIGGGYPGYVQDGGYKNSAYKYSEYNTKYPSEESGYYSGIHYPYQQFSTYSSGYPGYDSGKYYGGSYTSGIGSSVTAKPSVSSSGILSSGISSFGAKQGLSSSTSGSSSGISSSSGLSGISSISSGQSGAVVGSLGASKTNVYNGQYQTSTPNYPYGYYGYNNYQTPAQYESYYTPSGYNQYDYSNYYYPGYQSGVSGVQSGYNTHSSAISPLTSTKSSISSSTSGSTSSTGTVGSSIIGGTDSGVIKTQTYQQIKPVVQTQTYTYPSSNYYQTGGYDYSSYKPYGSGTYGNYNNYYYPGYQTDKTSEFKYTPAYNIYSTTSSPITSSKTSSVFTSKTSSTGTLGSGVGSGITSSSGSTFGSLGGAKYQYTPGYSYGYQGQYQSGSYDDGSYRPYGVSGTYDYTKYKTSNPGYQVYKPAEIKYNPGYNFFGSGISTSSLDSSKIKSATPTVIPTKIISTSAPKVFSNVNYQSSYYDDGSYKPQVSSGAYDFTKYKTTYPGYQVYKQSEIKYTPGYSVYGSSVSSSADALKSSVTPTVTNIVSSIPQTSTAITSGGIGFDSSAYKSGVYQYGYPEKSSVTPTVTNVVSSIPQTSTAITSGGVSFDSAYKSGTYQYGYPGYGYNSGYQNSYPGYAFSYPGYQVGTYERSPIYQNTGVYGQGIKYTSNVAPAVVQVPTPTVSSSYISGLSSSGVVSSPNLATSGISTVNSEIQSGSKTGGVLSSYDISSYGKRIPATNTVVTTVPSINTINYQYPGYQTGNYFQESYNKFYPGQYAYTSGVYQDGKLITETGDNNYPGYFGLHGPVVATAAPIIESTTAHV